ncbi:hypothetical protein [Actinomadura decatromicini]|uniref:DUF839 domain-containing protein n=1 Tax=Actinomadura decatromicini TaxID=2604572 RepID=A0A5D3FUG5_9ACTN|nr:hypothetical protein [Actinomadura decatromicini]TYK52497.1 hypothetical protein FXF68_01580 [Actinomadura decatromicini]
MASIQPRSFPRRRTPALAALGAAAAGLLVAGVGFQPAAGADAGAADAAVSTSSLKGSDGTTYTVTNHVVRGKDGRGHRKEWLLVWTGDAGPEGGGKGHAAHGKAGAKGSADPDFLAVIDATRGSPDYGKVVNTATLGPTLQNEPHHMQYVWHKGDKVFAGGLLSDTTYVFDVGQLPKIKLSGVVTPTDTPCGTVPDAFWTLKDGTAYGAYMGGPNVSGPCTYTHGETRIGNGAGGTPGEVLRLDQRGKVRVEYPAATKGPEAETCHSIPQLDPPSCANPHGIQAREDLNRLITSDFAEVRNLLGTPPADFYITRDTVRIYDIAKRDRPRLLSVSHLPDGPRKEPFGTYEEPRVVMETTVTNERRHRGAFASTMGGASIFYTPDITDPKPKWREVFDDTTAFTRLAPQLENRVGMDGGAWLQTSADDKYLYHTVMRRGDESSGGKNTGMVYVLDIRKLVASGERTRCSIDTLDETTRGGREPDCPSLVSVLPIEDPTSGGPHWAALDNFRPGRDGLYRETRRPDRLAMANYFVAATPFDGDHRVCMVNISPKQRLSLDQRFKDERTGHPCVEFNRAQWPHGATGDARPHGVLFAVSDADVR